MSDSTPPTDPEHLARRAADETYLAPAVVVLGSLDALTLGGNDGGPDDGFGTSGETDGSI